MFLCSTKSGSLNGLFHSEITGSDPNRIHGRGRGVAGSSLHEAAEKGHFDAVLLLPEHGAGPWIENSLGKTARVATQESLDEIFPEGTPQVAFNPRNAADLAEGLEQVILILKEELRIGLGAARLV